MDPKDVKLLIKEAKGFLKQQDGNAALKAARAVLRADEKHYMALVIEGAALQALKKPSNSLDSYRRAVKVEPNSPAGWKGIIDHYEKNNFQFATKDEVLEAYKRITVSLEKSSDDAQYVEQTLKFAGVLQSQGDFKQCVKVLNRLIKGRGNSAQIAKVTVGALFQMKELEASEEDLLLICLKVLHNANHASDEHLKKLFALLYKLERYEELEQVCLDLSFRFNTFYHPMEYLCRLYVENLLRENNPEQIRLIVEKLFKLYPSSYLGYFAQGKILFEETNYANAVQWFKEGIESKFDVTAAELLVIAQLQCWDFAGAEEYCRLALKNKLPAHWKAKFKLFLCQALVGQEKYQEAEIGLQEGGFNDLDTSLIRADMFAGQGMNKDLEDLLNKVDLTEDSHWKFQFYKNWKNTENLYALCEKNTSNFELLLKSAVSFFNCEDFMKCILTMNLCLNISSTHPIVQFYIAKLHRLEGNTKEARTYAKNAYESSPVSSIGTFLSDLYFEIEDHDANKSILTEATKRGKKATTKWAWLRLGILNLILGNANDAVVALHSALMTDHTDSSIWETLADAYFARGSYETSLRAYKKCLELGAQPTYPKFRIGVVHEHLGEEEMAVTILSELGDYNPALVELAKAWLQIAQKKFSEGLDVAVVEAIYGSMKAAGRALYLATSTKLILPLLIIGECAITASGLNKNLKFRVPAYFVEEKEILENVAEVGMEDLLLIGLRSLNSALSDTLSKTLRSSLEANMAKLYFLLSVKCGSNVLKNAVHHAKRAVLLEQESHANWNILGVAAAAFGNPKLAQHSFIKSINLNLTGNSTAWCNLGYLYIKQGKYFLAHRCFNQGQSCEPSYGYSWIGQALSAENLSPPDAMDLFRHACILEETHPFASLGYAEWVCRTLESENSQDYNYTIEYLEAVSTSLEKLCLYNVRTPTAASLNLQGILQAKSYLLRSAEESFQKSVILSVDPKLTEAVSLNIIGTLVELKEYSRALALAGSLPRQGFRSTAAAAVALEKTGEHSKAFKMYENLKKMAKTDAEMSEVLIAQGIVAFNIDGIENAKTLIFKGCESSSTPYGYLAICALALMDNEQQLAEAALTILSERFGTPKYSHDVAAMHSFFLVSLGHVKAALNCILKKIHNRPFNGKLRNVLFSHLINFHSEGGWARSSLLSASYLGQPLDMPGLAVTYLLQGDNENALLSAKKAVHVNRASGASWAVLVSSLFARFNTTRVESDLHLSLKCAKSALTYLDWTDTDPLYVWLQSFITSFSISN